MYVILDKDKVISTNINKNDFPTAIEAPDDIVFGDRYIDGEWIRCGERPEPIVLTPAEQREYEYRTNPLIEWEGRNITVDQANLVYLQYLAEGSPKAQEIQTLIIEAKEYIRQLHPNEEGGL